MLHRVALARFEDREVQSHRFGSVAKAGLRKEQRLRLGHPFLRNRADLPPWPQPCAEHLYQLPLLALWEVRLGSETDWQVRLEFQDRALASMAPCAIHFSTSATSDFESASPFGGISTSPLSSGTMFAIKIRLVRLMRHDRRAFLPALQQLLERSHHVVALGLGGLVATMAIRLENGADFFVEADLVVIGRKSSGQMKNETDRGREEGVAQCHGACSGELPLAVFSCSRRLESRRHNIPPPPTNTPAPANSPSPDSPRYTVETPPTAPHPAQCDHSFPSAKLLAIARFPQRLLNFAPRVSLHRLQNPLQLKPVNRRHQHMHMIRHHHEIVGQHLRIVKKLQRVRHNLTNCREVPITLKVLMLTSWLGNCSKDWNFRENPSIAIDHDEQFG